LSKKAGNVVNDTAIGRRSRQEGVGPTCHQKRRVGKERGGYK
jgi:hypothetical protein